MSTEKQTTGILPDLPRHSLGDQARPSLLWAIMNFIDRVHPSLVDPDARRRSKLLARLTLAIAAIVMGVVGLFAIADPATFDDRDTQTFMIGAALLVLTYVINRSGHFRAAAVFTAIVATAIPLIALVMPGSGTQELIILIGSVLLTAFVLSSRASMIVAILTVGLAGIAIGVGLTLRRFDYSMTLIVVAILDLLILSLMFHQERIERDRRRELEYANETLRDSEARLERRVLIRTQELQSSNQQLLDEIARRKRVEKELEEANHHLKDLDQLKDSFISSISHELRTPLTNMKIYHHLLAARPGNQAIYLETLSQETQRLSDIIEGILAVSQMMNEMQEGAIIPVDVAALVTQIITQWQPRARLQGQSLTYHAPSERMRVLGSAVLMQRVVTNLLDNALKYTPDGGEIRYTLRREHADDGRSWIVIEATNTSPAIPEGEIPRLFERFYRGQAALEAGVSGAGMGLYIAAEIVKHYGGHFDVRTGFPAGGSGVIFTIHLPEYIDPAA